MIQIYLDQCVYQDLKKEENKELLSQIISAKEYAVFCFSEAHLHDLNRDKTEEKFKDMRFIEEIAENHCYSFDKYTKFRYKTPRQYYEDYDWSDFDVFETLSDPLFSGITEVFKSFPLEFKNLVSPEQFGSEIPEAMKELFTKPDTMYDFLESMVEYSSRLSNDQPEFKKQLKYLHGNNLIQTMYASMGIEGYDGLNVTNKEKFRNSYANKFINEGQEKSRYELYTDMYHGLEIYGLVKGKPRKQKFMNLINDAKHSFFGTICDVIVSKDDDFLAKTKFMYDISEINTAVMHLSDLPVFLERMRQSSKLKLKDLVANINQPISHGDIIDRDKTAAEEILFVRLADIYFSYFDMLAYVKDKKGEYYYFGQQIKNFSRGTLVKQIQHVTQRLISDLGPDIAGRMNFVSEEIIEDKWIGRTWVIKDWIFKLILDKKLFLTIYPRSYTEPKNKILRFLSRLKNKIRLIGKRARLVFK
jgi:hypothetical protein